ncbi:MAG TPA: hypothetical protein VH087_01645 [Thermoanaerobaculia bacterium]|nr:hypothetical protein [Thermoanaerobaculia bacterium]
MPVIGLESEFKVFVDDAEILPEEYWRTPRAFITAPTLKRTTKSVQLPTGGALYFDGGVLEVVTPVIELAPECTARVVRSLWEQIRFVREQLDAWEEASSKRVRLQAFSCHTNISFELGRDERHRNRTIQKLAVLLARLLPVPVIVTGENRRSTGIGVRPRRDRVEITLDFTPEPGLMATTVALIVGIVRDVIEWPSYLLSEIDARGIPLLAGVEPGRHPSRKGWITRDFHFPKNPFTADIDAAEWEMTDGRKLSLRQVALEITRPFRPTIERYADTESVRRLFSLLEGNATSMLDLEDRPAAYDDVGSESKLEPPWREEPADRRARTRKYPERRTAPSAPRSLTRSAYERVFLHLGARQTFRLAGEELTPVAVKGWYHAVLRTPDGKEHVLSIDQLLRGANA